MSRLRGHVLINEYYAQMQPHSEGFTIAVAAFGSVLQEAMHWYGARFKINEKRFREMLRSPAYWGIVLVVCSVSAVGTWLWFYGEVQNPRTIMLTGAAFPVLLKKALKVVMDSSDTSLGDGTAQRYLGSF
jgi:hypothetical protein